MPTPAARPAETTTAAGALAVLVAYNLGLDDPQVVVSLAVVLGALPGIVTAVVEWRRRGVTP